MNKNRYKNEIILMCKQWPQNADQIFKKLKKYYPYLGIGTVYRNLSDLVDEWVLEKISWVTEKAIYDLKKDDNLHWHLVCESTWKVINVDISKIKNLDLWLPDWFNVSKVEVIFYWNFWWEDWECKGRIVMK